MKKLLLLTLVLLLTLSSFGRMRVDPRFVDAQITYRLLNKLRELGYTVLPEVIVTAYRNDRDTINHKRKSNYEKYWEEKEANAGRGPSNFKRPMKEWDDLYFNSKTDKMSYNPDTIRKHKPDTLRKDFSNIDVFEYDTYNVYQYDHFNYGRFYTPYWAYNFYYDPFWYDDFYFGLGWDYGWGFNFGWNWRPYYSYWYSPYWNHNYYGYYDGGYIYNNIRTRLPIQDKLYSGRERPSTMIQRKIEGSNPGPNRRITSNLRPNERPMYNESRRSYAPSYETPRMNTRPNFNNSHMNMENRRVNTGNTNGNMRGNMGNMNNTGNRTMPNIRRESTTQTHTYSPPTREYSAPSRGFNSGNNMSRRTETSNFSNSGGGINRSSVGSSSFGSSNNSGGHSAGRR